MYILKGERAKRTYHKKPERIYFSWTLMMGWLGMCFRRKEIAPGKDGWIYREVVSKEEQ